jgi:hypothetical protein
MLEAKFDALITFDKNLQYQQNFIKYTIKVFVLSAPINTYEVLSPLCAEINAALASNNLSPGVSIIRYK